MRLLVVGQHYWPEPFNLSTTVCEGLVARGHEVTIITGIPNYPEGEIYSGYSNKKAFIEDRNGVKIARSRLHPRKTGSVHRVWNYYSFAGNATKLAREIEGCFDAVVALASSPVIMARPAIEYSRKHNLPLLIYVIDLWPECLCTGGIKRDGVVYNLYRNVTRDIYDSADLLALTSSSFEEYIRNVVGTKTPSFYLPQFAENAFLEKATPEQSYDSSKFNLTFAGNVGTVQSVHTIVEAARLLKDYGNIIFHIVGDGSEFDYCRRLAGGLGNAIFHGRRPIEEMPAFYAASDAMLVTFSDDPVLNYTLPRKIQSYMASGRPIVAAVTGEAKCVIEASGCGICCDPEDAVGLAAACVAMVESELAEQAGDAGKLYYLNNFTSECFFEKFEDKLDALIGKKGTR